MKGSGMAMIGMGESDSGDRAIESVHEALNSPLLDLDISNAKGALINISGSSDLTLNEAEKVVQILSDDVLYGQLVQRGIERATDFTVEASNIQFSQVIAEVTAGLP